MADTKTTTRKPRNKRPARKPAANRKPEITRVTEVHQGALIPLLGLSKAALDALQTNVFLCDRNFDLVYVNQKARETLNKLEPEIRNAFGTDVEEMLKGSILQWHHDPKSVETILNNPDRLQHDTNFSFGEVRLETRINAGYDESGASGGDVANCDEVWERLGHEAGSAEAAA